jgi:hypothetical protein
MPDPKLKFRRIHFSSSLDGSQKRASIAATQAADDTSDDGHSDAGEDLYFSGGGVMMMEIVSYHQDQTHGDYLVCQPDGGGDTVLVAVEPQLQSGLGANAGIYSQTNPDGNTWKYTGYNAALQERTSTCISGPEAGTILTENITPPYVFAPVADRIKVEACGNTGVEVLNPDTEEYDPVTLVESRGRHWAAA